MKDLGAIIRILGMEIKRNQVARIMSLSKKGYIEKILCCFNMEKVKSVKTLLAKHFKLSTLLFPKTKEEIKYMTKILYSFVVGFLMYAMICT